MSGAENGYIYVWRNIEQTQQTQQQQHNSTKWRHYKHATIGTFERFAASASSPPIVTAACFAPKSVLQSIYGEKASPLKLIVSASFDGLLKVFEARLDYEPPTPLT